MSAVRSFAAWVMLASLMFIQAHAFVPHHHHSADAPKHWHTADHRLGLGEDLDHTAGVDCPHPETVPHDDLSWGDAGQRRATHFQLAVALPDPITFVLPKSVLVRRQCIVRADHPPATGPPGTKTSRAPPASFNA